MLRLAFTLGTLIAATLLQGCDTPEMEAVNADFILGDQCFYTLAQRPDDCFERAPCMWSDTDLHISEDDAGVFRLEADSGGWEVRSETPERTTYASAASPEALARQLPDLLASLHVSPPEVSQACVNMDPDQDMQVGDVVAFYRALTAQRVRRVGLFAVLADLPVRFGGITLSQRNDAALIQQMRRYADEHGFVFSQHARDAENRFQILGNGLAITAERVDAPVSESAFRVMLELSPQGDGALPTETMMDQLSESFAAAVGSVDGAALSIEQTSRR
ncbi:MAG TPA: hypothetical protein DHW63_01835 [Hyphomonadaceae bacterium]|nr:hypothetical protein [Hyphomonadaceae bacterium]